MNKVHCFRLALRKSGIAMVSLLILAANMSFLVSKVEASPSIWSIETVDAAISVGKDTSIALDSNDRPHISYFDEYWWDLKYARWTGSDWFIEPVDHVGDVGACSSIALDSNDRPHISYIDWTDGRLKYARWTGSTWVKEIVDRAPILSTSIALDSSDRPHISYIGWTNGRLKYARWTGSTWANETVDSGCMASDSSLALDSLDRPHISYYDFTNQDLKYAKWTGSTWFIETLDAAGDVGYTTSIAIDSNDRPHISYYDFTNRDLKYARWAESTWHVEIVDSAESVGAWSSIALDSNDRPHISYYDGYWDDLKYARWTGSDWFIEPVDHVGDVGACSSIALDSGDHPHISYYDADYGNLKYARAPDEYFFDVGYYPFDSDGDLQWDAVEIVMDVDTTYDGSLEVSVFGNLIDPYGVIIGIPGPSWLITHDAVEYEIVNLYVPPGSPEGPYDIGLWLWDGDDNVEDYWSASGVYLYPPDMVALTIEVDGGGTTAPLPGIHWVSTGAEFVVDAIPDPGWMLDHWLLDGSDIGDADPVVVVMDDYHVLRAIFATPPWDITGPTMWVPDGKCDMRDVALVAKLFGSVEGDGQYDYRADITGPTYLVPDGKIDMRDVALIAKHYGEIY